MARTTLFVIGRRGGQVSSPVVRNFSQLKAVIASSVNFRPSPASAKGSFGTIRASLITEWVANASWVNKGPIFGGGFSLEPPLMTRSPVFVVTCSGLTMVSQCFQIGQSTSSAVRHRCDVISNTFAV
jgi:hypothetical protein